MQANENLFQDSHVAIQDRNKKNYQMWGNNHINVQ